MGLKGRGVHAITKGEGAGEGRGEGSPGWNTSGWARGGPGTGMEKQQEETRRLGTTRVKAGKHCSMEGTSSWVGCCLNRRH